MFSIAQALASLLGRLTRVHALMMTGEVLIRDCCKGFNSHFQATENSCCPGRHQRGIFVVCLPMPPLMKEEHLALRGKYNERFTNVIAYLRIRLHKDR